ncbi:MAG: hypothetical protein WCF10_11645 [Polyangiales bacterium]
MRGRSFLAAPLLLSVLLAAGHGCKKSESKTTIAHAWTSQDLAGAPFGKVFVIGAERDNDHRRLYEDALVSALHDRGVEALASYDVLPQSEELTEEQIRTAIGTGDFDAVAITSLLHVDQSVEFVPPTTKQVPVGQFPHPVHFYVWVYETVHVPGYYKTHNRLAVEARLYRVVDGKRVWSAVSDTVNPDSVEEIIRSITAAMVSRLQVDGLVR